MLVVIAVGAANDIEARSREMPLFSREEPGRV
jgi:hypothetical protein